MWWPCNPGPQFGKRNFPASENWQWTRPGVLSHPRWHQPHSSGKQSLSWGSKRMRGACILWRLCDPGPKSGYENIICPSPAEFDELKSDLARAMKSSWFDTGVKHWQWPQRLGMSMNRHLTVAVKSSWFDIKDEHWRWPQRPVSLMN